MVQIAPSMLSADYAALRRDVEELEKAGADAEPQAGAEQQCQTKRPPHHAIDGIVHLRDHLDHSLFSPYTQNKNGQNPPKALSAKFGTLSFSAAGARRIPGCAPLRKDDGSVLLPERYSRFPCGLTPSAPTLQAGFSRVHGLSPPYTSFSVLPAHSCAR